MSDPLQQAISLARARLNETEAWDSYQDVLADSKWDNLPAHERRAQLDVARERVHVATNERVRLAREELTTQRAAAQADEDNRVEALAALEQLRGKAILSESTAGVIGTASQLAETVRKALA